ncbi:MAG TPA: hypothetical protein VN176_08225 [Verrucomicrobiae bacterium]|jgi:hypothetical protein|nr:hypothetical protein [Verrucomicrobiae bacterium]
MNMATVFGDALHAVKEFVANPKMLVATATGVVATAGTLFQNVSAILGYQSIFNRTQQEKEQIEETINLLAKLQDQTIECAREARARLEEDLQSSLRRLIRLTEEACRLRADPNHDLPLVQRLFVLFPAVGLRDRIVHGLTYVFMAAVVIFVLAGPYFRNVFDPGYYADAIVVAGYGALAFRAWALGERRWRLGYKPESGILRAMFVLREPANKFMLAAQIGIWTCLFWVAESLEDTVLDLANNQEMSATETFLKIMGPLAALALCRLWAVAELRSAATSSPGRWRAIFEWRREKAIVRWIAFACLAEFGSSIAMLFFKNPVFSEPLHTGAFVFQAAISTFACYQWMALSVQPSAIVSAEGQSKASSGSLIA